MLYDQFRQLAATDSYAKRVLDILLDVMTETGVKDPEPVGNLIITLYYFHGKPEYAEMLARCHPQLLNTFYVFNRRMNDVRT